MTNASIIFMICVGVLTYSVYKLGGIWALIALAAVGGMILCTLYDLKNPS